MPDTRRHRGPHPDDERLFSSPMLPPLRAAVADLSHLQERGYAEPSALKLVGDRYQLTERQRRAVLRVAASASVVEARRLRGAAAGEVRGRPLAIDGYNVLITLESALAGAFVFAARDGCHRDLASLHGNYRIVAETRRALELIGETLVELGPSLVRWLLDAPVSNSGRLAAMLRALARDRGWTWTVDLVPDADPALVAADAIVATADRVVLDRCARWLNLARHVVETRVPEARIVDVAVEDARR